MTYEEQKAYIDKLLKYIRHPDPETVARMTHGPELYRKNMLRYTLTDKDGKPFSCPAKVNFRQIDSEYEFGCNGFMLGGFKTPEENAAYEAHFRELFNLMVIPFYWGDLEPEKGKPRYAKDSPEMYRRPSPDLCLEFCEKNGITPKGHVLLYDGHNPDWLKRDTTEHLKRTFERHVREIAERYGDRIFNWDVTNEATYHTPGPHVPPDFVHFAFDLAEKYFPRCTRFNYNDGNMWRDQHDLYTEDNMLLNWIRGSGRRVDCIGMQMHMIGCTEIGNMLPWWSEQYFNPEHMNNVLDALSKTGLPISMSEITITGREDLGPDREVFQRFLCEFYYRLWFSHPNTNGIIWWNLVDDTALGAENLAKGGLLRRDMTPKPAYEQLKRLILHEWRTMVEEKYDPAMKNYVRGFCGNYEVTVETPDGRTYQTTERIVAGRRNEAKIRIELQ